MYSSEKGFLMLTYFRGSFVLDQNFLTRFVNRLTEEQELKKFFDFHFDTLLDDLRMLGHIELRSENHIVLNTERNCRVFFKEARKHSLAKHVRKVYAEYYVHKAQYLLEILNDQPPSGSQRFYSAVQRDYLNFEQAALILASNHQCWGLPPILRCVFRYLDFLSKRTSINQFIGRLIKLIDEQKNKHTLLSLSILYKELGDSYFSVDNYNQAKSNYQKALQLATDPTTKALILKSLGENESNKYHFNESINYFRQALAIYLKEEKWVELIDILRLEAGIHTQQGRWESAQMLFVRALEICDQRRNSRTMACAVLNDFGLYFSRQGLFGKARNCYLRSLGYMSDSAESKDRILILNNLSQAFISLKELGKAEFTLKKAIEASNILYDPIILGKLKMSQGNLSASRGEYEDAINHFHDAMNYTDDPAFLGDIWYNVGKVCVELNKLQWANVALVNSFRYYEESNYNWKFLTALCCDLSIVSDKLGDEYAAIYYQWLALEKVSTLEEQILQCGNLGLLFAKYNQVKEALYYFRVLVRLVVKSPTSRGIEYLVSSMQKLKLCWRLDLNPIILDGTDLSIETYQDLLGKLHFERLLLTIITEIMIP